MSVQCSPSGYWRSDSPIAWPGGLLYPPTEPAAGAAESGYYLVSSGAPGCVANPFDGSTYIVYRGSDYVGDDHPPNLYGQTGEDGEGPWEFPPGDVYSYSYGATYSVDDPEPDLPPLPVLLDTTPWSTPPPTYTRSRWLPAAATAPPEYTRMCRGTSWTDLIEGAVTGNAQILGAQLVVESLIGGIDYTIGQSLFTLPVQSAWDETFTYGTAHPIQGQMLPYSVPPDPTAPVPLPAGTIAFEQSGFVATLTDPVELRMQVQPSSSVDLTPGEWTGTPEVRSLTIYELPTSSPYHPASSTSGFLNLVPRSVLLGMDILWQGIADGSTVTELTLTVPGAATGDTSLLVVPTAMLSTTAPPAGGGEGTNLRAFYGVSPEVEIKYQGPRYLVIRDPVSLTSWQVGSVAW